MRKVVWTVLTLSGVAFALFEGACSSSPSDPPPLAVPDSPSTSPSTSTSDPPQEIRDVSPVTATVDLYMPSSSEQVLAPGADPGAAALDYIGKNGSLFGVPDARASYAVDGVITEAGATSVRLQQIVAGIPVWGVFKVVHFAADGSVAFAQGAFVPNLEPIARATPAVDEGAARATAESAVRTEEAVPSTVAVTAASAALVIALESDLTSPQLARHVPVDIGASLGTSSTVFVDAQTGAVIRQWTDLHGETQERATTAGFDGKQESFPVIASDGAGATTYRAGRIVKGTRGAMIIGTGSGGDPLNASALSGPWDTQVVSAVANVERVEDFLDRAFGYRLQGSKGEILPLDLRARIAGNANAQGGTDRAHTYGIMRFFEGVAPERPFVSLLHVIGHEYTHIVNEMSNGLGQTGEACSISEGVADVLGLAIQNATLGGETYTVGFPDGVVRDAQHPTNISGSRDNYKSRATGTGRTSCYPNAPIVDNAWFLMTVGGTNDTSRRVVSAGLGPNRATNLWWTTARKIITPTMTIPDLARAQVAHALKSDRAGATPVACAWLAVDALDEKWVKQQKITCPPAGADAGTDGGTVQYGGCTHDVCTFGEPLGPQCDPCTKKVCDVDIYCCTVHWGPSCSDALKAQCGKSCP
ncbi:M4 family metallopeptidase [Labilithrix luteola]|nr:M4 family metallopeptidase [Labilithrix luteola]